MSLPCNDCTCFTDILYEILYLFKTATTVNQYFNLCFFSEVEDDGALCQLYQLLRPACVFNTCK